MTKSEYYAREASLDDLKYIQQATQVCNSAYNTHGTTTKRSKFNPPPFN
jgi:hypothetical protein